MAAAIKLFGATITLKDGLLIHDHDLGLSKKKTMAMTTSSSLSSSSCSSDQGIERDRLKKPDKIIPCPRCKSMETKFCYFNNYNVNQPRHFCKGCHRYWTAGGVLRNVPVGRTGRRQSKPPPSSSHHLCQAEGDGIYNHHLSTGYDWGVVEQGRVQLQVQQILGIKRKWTGFDWDR